MKKLRDGKMDVFELVVLSIALAMDAFVVSVAQGICIKRQLVKKGIIIALLFGLFQGLMPTFGYLIGSSFTQYVNNLDHWIAFILLALIGAKMIYDGFKNEDDNEVECSVDDDKLDYLKIFTLAIATSIDALAVGFSFAFLEINILIAVSTIAIITFIICFIGVYLGLLFPKRFKDKTNFIAGVILILIGLRILLQHLNI